MSLRRVVIFKEMLWRERHAAVVKRLKTDLSHAYQQSETDSAGKITRRLAWVQRMKPRPDRINEYSHVDAQRRSG